MIEWYVTPLRYHHSHAVLAYKVDMVARGTFQQYLGFYAYIFLSMLPRPLYNVNQDLASAISVVLVR